MKKLVIYVLSAILFLESAILLNCWNKETYVKYNMIHEMEDNLYYISQNIDDTLSAKKETDVFFVSAQCTKFETVAGVYSQINTKIALSNLITLVQEYRSFLIEMSEDRYNENVENKLKRFQYCFDLIELSNEKDKIRFEKEIHNFNNETGNDAKGFVN